MYMLNYKIKNQECELLLDHGKIFGEFRDYFEGYHFDNCPFMGNIGYKYEMIKDILISTIPDNFHFQIMDCFANECEAPIDQLPYPFFSVIFSKYEDDFCVQFQLSFDDNEDEWRKNIRWIYEYYIEALKNQINMAIGIKFIKIDFKYEPGYYIRISDNNSNTLDEAFNRALPKLNEILVNTELALQGIDKFVRVLAFWDNNKSNHQENVWHNFFIDYSWILSQCFSSPFILFEDKAYVGGKDISNKNGNLLDFIYKNNLFDNIALLEIKTPQTALIGKEYRNNVFSISAELSGAINQLLNYKDKFQKEYYINRFNSETSYQLLNPKCILLVGTLFNLKNTERISFELFRSELKSIEIITYDELFEKVKLIKDILF